MTRPLLIALLALWSMPAPAADRSYGVGSFERVRVDGPFDVRIVTGGSPTAKISGDRRLIEQVDIAVDGTTLTVRAGSNGWGETPGGAAGAAPVVTLSTPRLTGVSVVAGGRVAVAPMRAQRIDLMVTGAGSLRVARAEADQLNATLIGTGTLTLDGKVQRARLMSNGPGGIDAARLVSNDLIIRVEGQGETKANARYTAQVTSTGLGRVTVSGGAKCVIKATGGAPVACGR